MNRLLRRLLHLLRWSRHDADLREEMELHRALRQAALERDGLAPADAVYGSQRALGNVALAVDDARDVWAIRTLDSVWHDVRFALRALRRTPGFTVAALLTLALGIGATTAMFSVVNAVLLSPPPYPDADRVLVLSPQGGAAHSGQIFHFFREHARSFAQISAQRGGGGWNLVAGQHAEYVTSLAVSAGFFEVHRIAPAIGRGFSAHEDQPGGPRAVVLSDKLWRRLFAGSGTDALGQLIQLGGVPHTVVGIMPAGFATFPPADLLTALQVSPRDNSFNYTVVGRLRDGVSPADAASELDVLRVRIAEAHPDLSENQRRNLWWMPLQQFLGLGAGNTLWLLLGAVSCLLVIACVNVAALQLVRAVGRRREMATRKAVGGETARLAQQTLTESMVLSVSGAALGLAAAYGGLQALLAFVPQTLLGSRVVTLDWRVLGLTVLLGLTAGVVFGLLPALAGARVDARAALWEGTHQTPGRGTLALRRLFAVAEVALAVVLLVSAGLLIRTFVNLRSVDLGFDSSNIVIGKMSLRGSGVQSAERPNADLAAFYGQTLDRLRQVPGVTMAAVANNIPIERGLNLAIEPPAGGIIDQRRAVDWRYVTPDYFSLFRIPVRAGRLFDERDGAVTSPVAVVDEAFAQTFFGHSRVIGHVIQLVAKGSPPLEIIGIVASVKGASGAGWSRGPSAHAAPPPPIVYVPATQMPAEASRTAHNFYPISWMVRTTDMTRDPRGEIQQILRDAAPHLPLIRFETMDEVIARDLATSRFLTTLLGVFGGVALGLAALGLYGLTAYAVTQRTQEVGVRMALGATNASVLRSFLKEGLLLAACGVGVGLVGAALASRLLASLLFELTPLDPPTFLGVSAVLVAVCGVATLIPALRAASIDPIRAMRLN